MFTSTCTSPASIDLISRQITSLAIAAHRTHRPQRCIDARNHSASLRFAYPRVMCDPRRMQDRAPNDGNKVSVAAAAECTSAVECTCTGRRRMFGTVFWFRRLMMQRHHAAAAATAAISPAALPELARRGPLAWLGGAAPAPHYRHRYWLRPPREVASQTLQRRRQRRCWASDGAAR